MGAGHFGTRKQCQEGTPGGPPQKGRQNYLMDSSSVPHVDSKTRKTTCRTCNALLLLPQILGRWFCPELYHRWTCHKGKSDAAYFNGEGMHNPEAAVRLQVEPQSFRSTILPEQRPLHGSPSRRTWSSFGSPGLRKRWTHFLWGSTT